MSISFSCRIPFVHFKPKPPAKLSKFLLEDNFIPRVSAREMATHPSAKMFLERAKTLYAAGRLRRASDMMLFAACTFACDPPFEPYPATHLIGAAAEIQLFLGKKEKARRYFNVCVDLCEAWGFPYSAREWRRRANEII